MKKESIQRNKQQQRTIYIALYLKITQTLQTMK